MKNKKTYHILIKCLSVILILVGVYYVGYGIGHNNLVFEKNYQPKIVNVGNGQPKDVDFSLFWDAWDVVKANFINKNLDYKKMVNGAISGMLSSLDDPYTMFMNSEESKVFNEDLNGSFGGIGVEITVKDGLMIIIAPLDDSPAAKAGIKSKDVITKIDGEDVGNYSYAEAINKIRGEKGTNVVLTVLHEGNDEPEDITITRDTIKNDSVKWEVKDDVMYIRISQFGDDTYDLMNKAAQEIQNKNLSKVIVDLRDNPGGYLTSSIDVASLFIPDGVIVQEQDRNGDVNKMSTTHIPRLKDVKLVVLINGGSASASEIFAGAMQDHKKGIIIGEKSFGKGSVQTLEKLEDGSQIKITIAKWLTPDGRAIDKQGISPDIEVKMSDDDKNTDNDIQLQKAIEEVNK